MSKKDKVKKKCCKKPPRKRCKRCPRNQEGISNEETTQYLAMDLVNIESN